MNNAIICDTTTIMIVNMLAEVEAEEPPVPDVDVMDQSALAEASAKHYEWDRKFGATQLMLGYRLVALAREQLIEQ